MHQEHIDKVKAYHQTEAYQKAMRKRGVWFELLFGAAKQFHWLRRFRLRRLKKVNIEGLMVAAGQNLKRLLKYGVQSISRPEPNLICLEVQDAEAIVGQLLGLTLAGRRLRRPD